MATLFSGTRIGYWSLSTNYINGTLTGNVSRSGNTVTLSGLVLAMNSTVYSTGNSDFTFTINGTSTTFRVYANGTTSLGSYSLNSATLSVTSSQTSASVSWSSSDGYSGTFPITFPASGTAPSTPTVNIVEIYPDGAKFGVNIGSYGTPSSEENRYIEADIFGTSSFGSPYRFTDTFRTTSSDIIVNSETGNSSPSGFTILPNTKYHYGGFASNTVLSTSVVTGVFVTTAPKATITIGEIGEYSASFSYSAPADGGYYDKTIEYSVDNGTTWVAAATITGASAQSGTFTVNGLRSNTNYTLMSRVTTSSGSTMNESLSFTTIFTHKLYGSVNGEAKTITKLYGSVKVPFTYYSVLTIANNIVNTGRFNSKYISSYGTMLVDPSELLVTTSGAMTNVVLKFSDNTIKLLFSYGGTYTDQGIAWGFNSAPANGNVSAVANVGYRHESKLITKLYGSLNGVTKRIY